MKGTENVDLLTSEMYTGASYFRGTNCFKVHIKIRMIKLENVHKFCRKNMKYVIQTGDKYKEKVRHTVNLYGSSDCLYWIPWK